MRTLLRRRVPLLRLPDTRVHGNVVKRVLALAVLTLALGCGHNSHTLKAYTVDGHPEFVCAFDLQDLHSLGNYTNPQRLPSKDKECNES